MGRRDDDEDREKLSWREIDQMRDRSRHVSREPKSYRERSLKSEWAKKQHLKEAEKYFLGRLFFNKYLRNRLCFVKILYLYLHITISSIY